MDGLTQTVLQTLSSSKISREDWLVLLDVSAQYQLPEVRTFAIQELSPMFAGRNSERISLARKYGVKRWLQEGLVVLIRRHKMVSDEDAEILG
jgi:hypothetical protein